MDGGLQLGWWSGSIRGDAICRSFPIGCLLKPASQFLGQSRLPAFTTDHGQNLSYVNVLEERNSFRARTLREKKENICTKPKNTRICVLAVLIAVQSIKVGKFQSFESPLHWLSMLFGDDLLGHYDTITGLPKHSQLHVFAATTISQCNETKWNTKQYRTQDSMAMEKPTKRNLDEKRVYLVAVWHRGGEGWARQESDRAARAGSWPIIQMLRCTEEGEGVGCSTLLYYISQVIWVLT